MSDEQIKINPQHVENSLVKRIGKLSGDLSRENAYQGAIIAQMQEENQSLKERLETESKEKKELTEQLEELEKLIATYESDENPE